MSDIQVLGDDQPSPSRGSTRLYVILAIVLVIVIVVVGAFIVVRVVPGLGGSEEPTAVADLTPTLAPTFTPGPTKSPTHTPPPAESEPPSDAVMLDTDNPIYRFESAGARPGVDWTGFFGQVKDTEGEPLSGVSVVVWYRDGTRASDIVVTDESGSYEIRLAEAPLAGNWSIQLLTDDAQPASKLFSFDTDADSEAGIQQVQVLWSEIP